jgi:hypothetical protein
MQAYLAVVVVHLPRVLEVDDSPLLVRIQRSPVVLPLLDIPSTALGLVSTLGHDKARHGYRRWRIGLVRFARRALWPVAWPAPTVRTRNDRCAEATTAVVQV